MLISAFATVVTKGKEGKKDGEKDRHSLKTISSLSIGCFLFLICSLHQLNKDLWHVAFNAGGCQE